MQEDKEGGGLLEMEARKTLEKKVLYSSYRVAPLQYRTVTHASTVFLLPHAEGSY